MAVTVLGWTSSCRSLLLLLLHHKSTIKKLLITKRCDPDYVVACVSPCHVTFQQEQQA
jgi:hypothetical protein